MNGENLLDTFRLLHLLLGPINAHGGLFANCIYGLVRYFKRNTRDGSLLNPAGPLPARYQFHHRLSYAQKAKSKHSPIKINLRVHNSLSNVVIHMPRINIHRAGHYQLEMVFLRARLHTSNYNG